MPVRHRRLHHFSGTYLLYLDTLLLFCWHLPENAPAYVPNTSNFLRTSLGFASYMAPHCNNLFCRLSPLVIIHVAVIFLKRRAARLQFFAVRFLCARLNSHVTARILYLCLDDPVTYASYDLWFWENAICELAFRCESGYQFSKSDFDFRQPSRFDLFIRSRFVWVHEIGFSSRDFSSASTSSLCKRLFHMFQSWNFSALLDISRFI